MMRELSDIQWEREPSPENILLHGVSEISGQAPGGHADPNNPCYGEKRKYKEFAERILDAYRKTRREWGKADTALPNALPDSSIVACHIVEGPEGYALYINDIRVSGPKPWGGGTVVMTFSATVFDLLEAIGHRKWGSVPGKPPTNS